MQSALWGTSITFRSFIRFGGGANSSSSSKMGWNKAGGVACFCAVDSGGKIEWGM